MTSGSSPSGVRLGGGPTFADRPLVAPPSFSSVARYLIGICCCVGGSEPHVMPRGGRASSGGGFRSAALRLVQYQPEQRCDVPLIQQLAAEFCRIFAVRTEDEIPSETVDPLSSKIESGIKEIER